MSFLDNLNPQQPKSKPSTKPVTDNRPMDEIFMTNLPNSLYWNHYELNERFPNHTANDWRRYLRDMDRFISQEVAAIAEANARKALDRLGAGMDMKQGEIGAINQLLNRSEQLNKNMKSKTQTITTFLPPVASIGPKKGTPTEHARQQNRRVVYMYYEDRELLQKRLDRGELRWGEDGIMHFPSKVYMTHIDRLYKHFHNPRNLLNGEKVKYDHED